MVKHLFIALGLLPLLLLLGPEVRADQGVKDQWSAFERQLDERERFIREQLKELRAPAEFNQSHLDDLGADFCVDFAEVDAMVLTGFMGAATWQRLWRRSVQDATGARPFFLSELFTLVERCSYSRGAAYRAAFMLDYMYWNRMVDRVGLQVADALRYRDYFYEIKTIRSAADKIASIREGGDHLLRTAGDFLDAPEMRVTFFLRLYGNLTTALLPSRRRAFRHTVEILDLRQNSWLMFGNDILEHVKDEENLRIMTEFHEYLLQLQQDPRQLARPHGGWAYLMHLAGGDEVKATHTLALLATLRTWVLEELSDTLLKKDELTPEILRAFYAGANTYFLMNQLDEQAAFNGDDPYTVRYHFFYPPGVESTNWKAYHWFANTHIGCELARRGVGRRSAKTAVKRLAQGYEALTLNIALPTKAAINDEPRARAIIEGWEDVAINTEGGVYGWEICSAP